MKDVKIRKQGLRCDKHERRDEMRHAGEVLGQGLYLHSSVVNKDSGDGEYAEVSTPIQVFRCFSTSSSLNLVYYTETPWLDITLLLESVFVMSVF